MQAKTYEIAAGVEGLGRSMKMQKSRKKPISKVMAAVLAVVMSAMLMPSTALAADSSGQSDDIVILFTGDVCGKADENLGYAGLAAYRNEKQISNKYVAVVDAGDAVSGTLLASVSRGRYIVEAMNLAGYTAAVPGVREFDYGVSHFRNILAEEAVHSYVSCNYIYASTGSVVFSPYRMVTFGEKKVAFLGISDPLTMSKNSEAFQAAGGSAVYSFCSENGGQELYERVQSGINQAKAAGADYIIAVGYLPYANSGNAVSPYSAAAVIKNTEGIQAFIQGGSRTAVVGEKLTDKNGNTVLLSSAGAGLEHFGQLVISGNKTITASMISNYGLRDIFTRDGIEALKTSYNAELSTAFASTSSRLEATDTSGNRTIDKKETNLGDLCADAYRSATGADIALVESGEIRTSLPVGSISYKDITKVLPQGRSLCVSEVSGADLMDALEMSARMYPNQNSGFLQISGLTYDIQETVIPSVSLDGMGNFSGITGEYRVTNIMINGKELDLFGTYTVAGTENLLGGETGYTMFTNGTVKKTAVTTDQQALITYISNDLKGSIGSLYGKSQGRVDSIRLVRQSELDQEVAALVKKQMKDYDAQIASLTKQLQLKDQVLAIKSTEITASSKFGKSSGKRYIQITWKVSDDISGMKYQVWKSSKSSSGYKKMISTSKTSCKNTSGLIKGKTYYYKVRGYKSIGGKYYYTNWSNKVYKKVA